MKIFYYFWQSVYKIIKLDVITISKNDCIKLRHNLFLNYYNLFIYIIKLMSKQEEDTKLQLLESPFECNICLEIATEPILTNCGHLFCWPCIYSVFIILVI